MKESNYLDFQTRAKIGTNVAYHAIAQCRQKGAEDYLQFQNVCLLAIIDLQKAFVNEMVGRGDSRRAMAVEAVCSEYMAEARKMEQDIIAMFEQEDGPEIILTDPQGVIQ